MPANNYYTHTSGQPTQLSRGSSSAIRAEFDAIEAAFYKIGQELGAASSAADFKLIYQGARASDPTQRYNGTQLQNGDLYFNTSVLVMKSFANGTWYSLVTSTSAMLKDGGEFTGPIKGTSAEFSSSVKAAGFTGSGAGLTDMTSLQITSALGFTPLNKAGDSMTGQLNGTVAVFTGSVTGADIIISSDERRKQKWEKLPDDIIDQFAAIKKIGTYFDKKQKMRKAGVGAQSMIPILPEAVAIGDDMQLGVAYGQAALVLLHKAIKRIQQLEKRLAKLEK